MKPPRFHVGEAIHPHIELQLPKETSQHIAGALRLKAQDELVVFNSSDGEYLARVNNVSRNSVSIEVVKQLPQRPDSPLVVHLGMVMLRGDKMDLVIQKATELGVAEITPLRSDRCDVRLNENRESSRLSHWQRVAISSCEQCGRTLIPLIHPIVAVESWLKSCTEYDERFVLHPTGNSDFSVADLPRKVALLIGPEGGFTDGEITDAQRANFGAVCLGQRILRAETAPISSLAILQYLWGDLKRN